MLKEEVEGNEKVTKKKDEKINKKLKVHKIQIRTLRPSKDG